MKSIVLYMHVHQPYRIRHYSLFETGKNHNYFDSEHDAKTSNYRILKKVAEKSYIPTNQILLELLTKYPNFRISLSITGTVLEQLEQWSPAALQSFQSLVRTGQVEIVAETYHHSLAFFYSLQEFQEQVDLHREKIQYLFGVTPTAFRNTELAYNNDLAVWADRRGYQAILAEGWDPVLGWRSPNYVYKPTHTSNVKLLLKNYKLSDDIAFRFSDKNWSDWPLNADKFSHWLNESGDADIFNLFMDYETFGEHQWKDSGIFTFLRELPDRWLADPNNDFKTVTQAATDYPVRDEVDVPQTVTWADTERDLTAWLGNPMQQEASKAIYSLHNPVLSSGDQQLIDDWRRLTTSDNFYYMCTKWWNDGDVHAYFSPYDSPYEAHMNFMNSWHDIRSRLIARGISI